MLIGVWEDGGLLAAEVCVSPVWDSLTPARLTPANDLATPPLHSINIWLKSIMSLLKEIKLNAPKATFPLCLSIWAFPWRCRVFHYIVASCSFWPDSNLLNLLSSDWFQQFYELSKCPGLTWQSKRSPYTPSRQAHPLHKSPKTKSPINIAMETKCEEMTLEKCSSDRGYGSLKLVHGLSIVNVLCWGKKNWRNVQFKVLIHSGLKCKRTVVIGIQPEVFWGKVARVK